MFSLLFLLPAWHLSRTFVSPLARGVVLLMGALVVIGDIAALLTVPRIEDPLVARLVLTLGAGYPFVAFLVFIGLVWRALRIATPAPGAPDTI